MADGSVIIQTVPPVDGLTVELHWYNYTVDVWDRVGVLLKMGGGVYYLPGDPFNSYFVYRCFFPAQAGYREWTSPNAFTFSVDAEFTLVLESAFLEVDTTLTAIGPTESVAQGEVFNISGVLTRIDTDSPIPNMTIELRLGSVTGTLIATTTTNVNGSYTFNIIHQGTDIITYMAYFPGADVVDLTLRSSMGDVRVGLEGVSLLPLLILGGVLLLLTRK